MDQLTDHRILQGCIGGDIKAQNAFVRRFSSLIYQTVKGTLRARNLPLDKLDLEDLHSTVFVRLFEKECRKLRQYKGKNGCSIASWIRLIAVRTVLDSLRKARTDLLTRREKIVSLDAALNMEAEAPGQWAFMESAERSGLIQKALQALPHRDRLLLKLHCEQGLSLQEVAEMLKISEGNAYSVKHRAIKRLAAKLAQ